MRKLLLHSQISGEGGNCRVIDTTTVLHVPSSTTASKTDETIDVELCRNYGIDVSDTIADPNYDITPEYVSLSEVAINVVTYIAGFVLKMLCSKTIYCAECIWECFETRDDFHRDKKYKLLSVKDRGKFEYIIKSSLTN